MSHKLLLLPGDGIGVEVMGEVEKLVAWLNQEQKADLVTDTGVAATRAAQHLDAHDSARAGVVGDVQVSLHLDHGS